MVESLTEDEIADLKKVFTQHDKDGDGCIATTELGSVLHALKYPCTDSDIQDFVADIDPDNYGIIDFCEFLSLISRKARNIELEESLLETFKVYDRDGNGYISASELLVVMRKLGEEITLEEANAMIVEVDQDGDGQVNFKDFVRIMTEKPS